MLAGGAAEADSVARSAARMNDVLNEPPHQDAVPLTDARLSGRYVDAEIAGRSLLASMIASLEADARLAPCDVLFVALSASMMTHGPLGYATNHPIRAEDSVRLLRQRYALAHRVAPRLVHAAVQQGITPATVATLINAWAGWAKQPPPRDSPLYARWKAIEEGQLLLEHKYVLARLPHLDLAGGVRALDPRPLLGAVRRCAARKGVALPRDDQDLLDDIKEVIAAPHNSVSRHGNLRWRWGRDGRWHPNENWIVDLLRTLYGRRARPRGDLDGRPADEARDASDALDAVLATAVGLRCQQRGPSTLAALFVHAGTCSYREAAARFGVSHSAVQRAMPWVRREFPALGGRRGAP
jgi:hypothetical protein